MDSKDAVKGADAPDAPPASVNNSKGNISKESSHKACDVCKRRKVRCSGSRPCQHCQRNKTVCTYTGTHGRLTALERYRLALLRTEENVLISSCA